ncbi:gamma-glutamyltransferase [Sphingomonas sp. PAMC 26605]|uniref:gamma-glutamyltransferase n=1 Tax=Sphingomonas sp. PAMC 26605 TaxID=1112214 RepID=UPI00026CB193|nr:gamma-glutamyltransferase [Sphingomonas sp. PAMC 26605]
MTRPLVASLLLLIAPATADAGRAAPTQPAALGMVSAADPRAAAAGAEILRKGGSATDAAIATMLVLNVVEPQNSGIGGGSFMLHHDAATNALAGFDGREAAPAAADAKWFYGADGKPLPVFAAIPGGRSVGVPGNLRMMALAHQRFGKLPWATLFGPAIKLAQDGFAVSPRLHNGLTNFGRHIDPAARALFLDADGKPLPVGTLLKNPAQAELFGAIAKNGPDYFYKGAVAQKIVTAVNTAAQNPSKMTLADLSGYRAKERPPVCTKYRIYKVCSMGPPSSGGIAVQMILKQLERFDMAGLGKDSPVAWHLFAESERLAYADRDLYLGDPDLVSIPIKGLLDPAYLAKRSALISPEHSMASITAGTPPGAPKRTLAPNADVPGTSDLVAVDKKGNVAEVTTTIESYFGSGLSVDGVMLNNELTDFDFIPAKDGYLVANRVQGGKRPRSSMAPTIVYGPDGKVRIALGAAGGSTIIAQVAKALVAVLDWKLSAQDAIALGLLYAPKLDAAAEKGTQLDAMVPALEALGEHIQIAPLGLKANAIERVGDAWVGAADPRSEGVAVREDGQTTQIVRAGALPRPAE